MSEEENKNDKNEIIINKIEEPKNQLTLLTLDEYDNRKKLTKFTSKSNKRWIYFKPKIINPEENNKILESKKQAQRPDNSKILEKWKELQKSIKEEISLEELMIEKQMQDNSQLKEKFREYYNVKLKCRKEYEIINNIGNDKQKEKDYVINNNIERDLLDTCEPIKNFLFLMRNNADYIVKLKYLLTDEKEKVNSLVELLCNQFYDNILIPSQNQNNVELGILIYKLLEDEIITMNSAAIDDFLNDNSFIGKFLSVFVRKDEFRLFFGKLLKPILIAIENKDDDCLDISILNIKSKLNKRDKEKEKIGPNSNNISTNNKDNLNNKEDDTDYFSILYKDIPKSTVEFKKNMDLDDDKSQIKYNNEDNINKKNSIHHSKKIEEINQNENSFSNSDTNLPNIKKRSKSIIEDEFNLEYYDDLKKDTLISKILKEQDKDMKDFYIHQLEQINSDPDIFTNNGLKNIISEYIPDEGRNILNKYKQNFIFIKNLIDSLLQELIDKIHIIPYSLKCICKIIYVLISKKFPNLPKFYRNAFIGKFLFDKCIFPILSLDSKNAIINRVFSSCVKSCVNVIINVLSNANRGCLYQTNSETEKTIFNYYLIEIIPILNKFYDQLMDIKLPSLIEKNMETIDKQIEENKDNKIFHFHRKKNPSNIINNENNKDINNINNIKNKNKKNDYDYFQENPEEIMRLQGICFSIQDILFLLSLVTKEKMKIFKNLPEYDFFNKTVERINCDDYKLTQLVNAQNNLKEKENIKQIFYVIYKDERNNQLENLFKAKKKDRSKFSSDDNKNKESAVILNKIKFCIKNILKNIELNFSYLDKATSTDKLFSALFYHLNEIGENSEIYDQVPIKWYAQYIYENKNNLDLNYRKNDYELLYKEMTEEEIDKLDELKNITSKIITKNNINLNCATDLVNKVNYSLDDIIEEKKIAKLEIFIETEEIKVCILTSKDKDKDKQKLIIRDVAECQINNSDYHKDSSKNKNKLSCHTHHIKDFINKFSYESWEKESKLPSPKKLVIQEIIHGQRNTKIHKAFKDYMNIIKKKIKEPVNNKNLFKDINDYNDLLEKIEDFIFRQIYKYVSPSKKLNNDNKFFQTTQELSWITPDLLDIKNISINQLGYSIKCIEKMDDMRSVNDKLNCIREAHAALNNVIKFSNGSDANAGQDEITPIFQYIIIKAQPKKIYTNMSYIKAFLDESELSGSKGFLITQMESAISYIEKLDPSSLKMKQNGIYDEVKNQIK